MHSITLSLTSINLDHLVVCADKYRNHLIGSNNVDKHKNGLNFNIDN